MSGYTATGPFVNGSSPALAAAFFNNLETWIQQAEADIGASTVSGSSSGTATLYQVLQGTYKKVLILVSTNYNSTVKTIALPVAFTVEAEIRAYRNVGPMRYLTSGSAQNIVLANGFNASGAFTTTGNITSTPAGAAGFIGSVNGPFDTVEFSATGAVGPAIILLEGN
jgi:hypothetical protein